MFQRAEIDTVQESAAGAAANCEEDQSTTRTQSPPIMDPTTIASPQHCATTGISTEGAAPDLSPSIGDAETVLVVDPELRASSCFISTELSRTSQDLDGDSAQFADDALPRYAPPEGLFSAHGSVSGESL